MGCHEINCPDYIKLETESRETVIFGADEYIPMTYVDAEIYVGATSVTPSTESVTLQTGGKLVADDITVNAIPYTETANAYGTTVTIGA